MNNAVPTGLSPHKPEEKNKWVLCVDDHFAARAFVSEVLVSMGLHVHGAENAEDGLKLFEQYPFDLVFTDYDMPGINGLVFSKQLTTLKPAIPVVLFTASPLTLDAATLKECGVSHVLKKPALPEEIRATVNFALSTSNGKLPLDVLASLHGSKEKK